MGTELTLVRCRKIPINLERLSSRCSSVKSHLIALKIWVKLSTHEVYCDEWFLAAAESSHPIAWNRLVFGMKPQAHSGVIFAIKRYACAKHQRSYLDTLSYVIHVYVPRIWKARELIQGIKLFKVRSVLQSVSVSPFSVVFVQRPLPIEAEKSLNGSKTVTHASPSWFYRRPLQTCFVNLQDILIFVSCTAYKANHGSLSNDVSTTDKSTTRWNIAAVLCIILLLRIG